MTNLPYLAKGVEANRLYLAEIQFQPSSPEPSEHEVLLDEADPYAPKMVFHRIRNIGWVVAVELDSFHRPSSQNSFSKLNQDSLTRAGFPVQVVNEYALFIKSNRPEAEVREAITIACLPF